MTLEAKQHSNLRRCMQIAKQYLRLSYLQIIARCIFHREAPQESSKPSTIIFFGSSEGGGGAVG